MPELPEVETVVAGIRPHLVGTCITEVVLRRADIRLPIPTDLPQRVAGQRVLAVSRRAKYVQVALANGYTLLVHLGMSGRLTLLPQDGFTPRTHDHVLWRLEDGMQLVFHDPRRFGVVTGMDAWEVASHPLIRHLGPEPLGEAWDGKALHQALQGRRVAIKQAIMDARLVVGVGNIYASETLFRARILPDRPVQSLSTAECHALVATTQQVLREAIASGGSTLRDYVRSSGDPGYFQHKFQVYGREGEGCVVCDSPVQRLVQGGRSSFFCASCQQ
jgi:formamidopyrimidine-DNA glycosylase